MLATAVKAPFEVLALIHSDSELMRAVSHFIESDLGEDKRQYVGPPTVADLDLVEAHKTGDPVRGITLPAVLLTFTKRRALIASPSGWEVEVTASEADLGELKTWPGRYARLAEWNRTRSARG